MMIDTRPAILVVDDEVDILSTTRRLLERMLPECAIITASDADTVLALVRARPIRVALIDYRLPHMDGLTLAAAIRAQDRAVQLILISATMSMLPLPGGAQAHGLFATLSKPYRIEELVQVVRAALAVP
jgi:DNA-binding NtrC family response regulator